MLESDGVDGAFARRIRVGQILHPSPASPAANRGWEEAAERQLAALGLPGLAVGGSCSPKLLLEGEDLLLLDGQDTVGLRLFGYWPMSSHHVAQLKATS